MGFWEDVVSYTGDLVKRNTPDPSAVKREVSSAYHSTSAAVAKKLHQYRPNDETIDEIGLFATIFAKKAAKRATDEALKQPVVSEVYKLATDTMLEVKQQKQKDGTQLKMDGSEKYLMKSTQNGKLSKL